eukprot:m.153120 g.153120  ORF g.153120 m.153120 type:complete len:366 (-) comp10171_c8_seq4:416-1513(-)
MRLRLTLRSCRRALSASSSALSPWLSPQRKLRQSQSQASPNHASAARLISSVASPPWIVPSKRRHLVALLLHRQQPPLPRLQRPLVVLLPGRRRPRARAARALILIRTTKGPTSKSPRWTQSCRRPPPNRRVYLQRRLAALLPLHPPAHLRPPHPPRPPSRRRHRRRRLRCSSHLLARPSRSTLFPTMHNPQRRVVIWNLHSSRTSPPNQPTPSPRKSKSKIAAPGSRLPSLMMPPSPNPLPALLPPQTLISLPFKSSVRSERLGSAPFWSRRLPNSARKKLPRKNAVKSRRLLLLLAPSKSAPRSSSVSRPLASSASRSLRSANACARRPGVSASRCASLVWRSTASVGLSCSSFLTHGLVLLR